MKGYPAIPAQSILFYEALYLVDCVYIEINSDVFCIQLNNNTALLKSNLIKSFNVRIKDNCKGSEL